MGSYSPLVKPNTIAFKKRLGQHFLRDTGMIDRIVRWIDPGPDDIFIEIGAGDGALSVRIAPLVAKIFAVEIDEERIPLLKAALSPFDAAEIVRADILEVKPKELLAAFSAKSGQKLRVAGNLPYNISTAIISAFLKSDIPLKDMFFMVQTEVAQRIAAPPGNRQYGYLSVLCGHHCDVQSGFKVSPSCFVPRPKVSSSMISLKPKDMPRDPGFESDFEQLVKAAFSHRRKTLANSLGRHAAFSSICDALLRRAGIDGSRRAETLSVSEFENLTAIYRTTGFRASGDRF
jgi:16S rRNA (adenine1518-N6/adenine1519-N6)-dimethyltransferase